VIRLSQTVRTVTNKYYYISERIRTQKVRWMTKKTVRKEIRVWRNGFIWHRISWWAAVKNNKSYGQYEVAAFMCFTVLSYSLGSIFYQCMYMVLFLFNNVIYVFLLLWLCILIVCLCMATLTEVFRVFFFSCKANARPKPAKTGHGPHSSWFLCCSLYCLCVNVYCTTATGWLPNCS